MILSELTLDQRHPSVRRAITDCNDMHRNIIKAFPDDLENVRRVCGVLYRVLPADNGLRVLVLSEHQPAWERLAHNGYTCSRSKNIDALANTFENERVFGFDLLCMPAKKVGGDGKNSRRVMLTLPEERMEWLQRKADQNGFRIISCLESGQTVISGKRQGNFMAFTGTVFKGNLQIVDAARFAEAYRTGIGPEKAYGMGMLLLGRPL